MRSNNSKNYKVEVVCDSAVYVRESENNLSGFYYLLSWKNYPEGENTWKSAVAAQYLQRLLSIYHKKNLERFMAIFKPINTISPIARLSRSPKLMTTKKKQGQSTKASDTNKHTKKS